MESEQRRNIMNMRRVVMGLLVGLLASVAAGQQGSDERITVPLSDPSRPAMLKVGLLTGSIFVKAYAGKDIIVELTRKEDKGRGEAEEEEREERSVRGRSKAGLRLIPNTSADLTVEEEDNVVEIGTSHRGLNVEKILKIQVPINTSVKLSTVNEGDIEVEGTNGEIEVNNTNGSVHLLKVSGSAVAHALNGDLTADFVAATPGKSMSFSSLNGTIEVTFPPTIKASLDLKSEQGEIYTDFDIVMEKSTPKIEEKGRGKKRRVVMEKAMRGNINGGGAEILFKNFNGDIIIRKRK
jgi:hypothetical protein